jgi:ribosomal protein S18 acetylase RimI-like enzyme
MPTLLPMLQPEFDLFLERSIPEYAEDKVRAGNWTEAESLERSRREFEELLPQGLNTSDNFLYTLYNDDKEAVGMIWIKVDQTSAFIYEVYIEEKFRGMGHGKSIMLLLEEKAREMGIKTLKLHVFGSNHVARKLYETVGYEITNVNMSKTL